ncbi:hypothetical protein [Hydrogenophaga pseudoflava]|nr:hypothetical protein [Hydrogenophaga pseudoflava]MDQ7747251.1 hypothetical protein [Hydrogenophaga pseudoflava]
MPVWLQNEGAWIALGVSVLFIVAGVVMHRVIKKVLQTPQPEESQKHE